MGVGVVVLLDAAVAQRDNNLLAFLFGNEVGGRLGAWDVLLL
jgi:CelD/BcsL family acetyltransferase involved in cellulose biosynthesis